MNTIEALQQRVSVSKLTAPGPTLDQCRQLVLAATRAADHGSLRPWRFLTIEQNALDRLGELFVRVACKKNSELTAAEIERFKSMPLRAPMIMVVIGRCQDHPKVPKLEQLLSAAAAAQNVINAAYAMGLGAIWRTGDLAYDREVAKGLGLNEEESIIGFIYLGTPLGSLPVAKNVNPDDFFSQWSGE